MICSECKTILSEEEEKESDELDWGRYAYCPLCRERLEKKAKKERTDLQVLAARALRNWQMGGYKDYDD